jgi:hypothetical protein
MEAICSSETSVDTQRTTLRYIPEDGTLQAATGFLLCLFFHPKDIGDMLVRNVCWLSTDYTALYDRR